MSEPLTELQGLMYLADLERRRYLLEQLEMKEQLGVLLQQETNPIKVQEYRDGLSIISNNIAKMRVAGLM